jgi:hypothetical protein
MHWQFGHLEIVRVGEFLGLGAVSFLAPPEFEHLLHCPCLVRIRSCISKLFLQPHLSLYRKWRGIIPIF